MSYTHAEIYREKPEIFIAPMNIDSFPDFNVTAHRETFRITFGTDITDEFLENELARTRTNSSGDENSVVGAFSGNEIAGHAVLEIRGDIEDHQFGWIHFYYVAPQFRRQGIGLRLVSYSSEYFKALGLKEFCLRTGENNKAAQAFYLSAGFSYAPEGNRIGFNGVNELMMRLRINSIIDSSDERYPHG